MTDIILIVLAGLFTIVLSVRSAWKSDKTEKESEKKQAELMRTIDSLKTSERENAVELKSKSDEIIGLYQQLQEKSEAQILALRRQATPIPSSLTLNFQSTIKHTLQEIQQITAILKSAHGGRGNVLPVPEQSTSLGYEKIELLSNCSIRLQFVFAKEGKTWSAILEQHPLPFFGYNTTGFKNAYNLSLRPADNTIDFSGLALAINDVSANYASPSLLDFSDCDVVINVQFFYPQAMKVGSIQSTPMFVADNNHRVQLQLKEVSFTHRGYSVKLENLRETGPNRFHATWTGLE